MNQTIEIYLLDDNPIFLQTFSQELEAFLRQRHDTFRLHCFTCGDALLAQAATAERIDLLIADIFLDSDRISGLSVAGQLRRQFPSCGIIYLTAFLKYATDIYDTRPLYFILKEEYQQRIPAAMELFFQDYTNTMKTLTVSTGRTKTAIHLQDLIYCEHIGRKTKLVCTDRQLFIPDTIDKLAAKLPQQQFIVSHKGYIINLNYVVSYRRYFAVLNTGQELPISRSRYDSFRAAYASYLAT